MIWNESWVEKVKTVAATQLLSQIQNTKKYKYKYKYGACCSGRAEKVKTFVATAALLPLNCVHCIAFIYSAEESAN